MDKKFLVEITLNISKYMSDKIKNNRHKKILELVPSTEYITEYMQDILDELNTDNVFIDFILPSTSTDVTVINSETNAIENYYKTDDIHLEIKEPCDEDKASAFINYFNKKIIPKYPYARLRILISLPKNDLNYN